MGGRATAAAVLCILMLVAPADGRIGRGEAGGPVTLVQGSYGGDPGNLGLLGFNTVNVMPYRSHLNRLSELSLSGVVWLWGYKNHSCSFARSQRALRPVIRAIAGHPAISAYQIADEPNAAQCPNAPKAVRRRHRFIKSIDPRADTYVVVSAWNGRTAFPYEDFAGTTSVMGLDVYPCTRYRWDYPGDSTPPCKFRDIEKAIRQARKDGVRRYWAVIQAFSDSWHRMPSRAELAEQFARWSTSGMEGYFLFTYDGHGVTGYGSDLELVAEVALQNYL